MTQQLAEFSNDKLYVHIDAYGRILVKVLDGATMVLEDSMSYFKFLEDTIPKLNLQFPRPVCIDIRDAYSIGTDAHQYSAMNHHYHSCIAIINADKETNRIGNFWFMTKELNLPLPIRVFCSTEKGLNYITQTHNELLPKDKLKLVKPAKQKKVKK
jgi:hypothetical protein